MTDFIIKKLPYSLTSNSGLALVGQYLKRLDIGKALDRVFPIAKGGIANSDVLKSYLGLLVQGKNDFEAIEAFRSDAFFAQSLSIGSVPSSSTLRQRLNANASDWFTLADGMNERLLSGQYAGGGVDFGALPCGYMPVDWDTFVMNNDGSKKEDVGRTYQGVDGYTPSATYLGTLGYCLELALRPGVQHSALETELNLERVLPMAARLTPMPLLFRADSGLCSLKVMQEIDTQAKAAEREIAFIIKWNRRKTPVETIAAQRVADANTLWCHWREGKRQCVWQETLTLEGVGSEEKTGAAHLPLDRAHDRQARQPAAAAGLRAAGLDDDTARVLWDCPHHCAVLRPWHARAVSLGVQDRHGSAAPAIGQV